MVCNRKKQEKTAPSGEYSLMRANILEVGQRLPTVLSPRLQNECPTVFLNKSAVWLKTAKIMEPK